MIKQIKLKFDSYDSVVMNLHPTLPYCHFLSH